jgi:hypothetical protein
LQALDSLLHNHQSPAGVLAGLFWLQKGKNNTVLGAQQTIGLLFFELLFLSFRALFTALFTFPDERKMLLKVPTRCPAPCV